MLGDDKGWRKEDREGGKEEGRRRRVGRGRGRRRRRRVGEGEGERVGEGI